jgi:hypothetical protein
LSGLPRVDVERRSSSLLKLRATQLQYFRFLQSLYWAPIQLVNCYFKLRFWGFVPPEVANQLIRRYFSLAYKDDEDKGTLANYIIYILDYVVLVLSENNTRDTSIGRSSSHFDPYTILALNTAATSPPARRLHPSIAKPPPHGGKRPSL